MRRPPHFISLCEKLGRWPLPVVAALLISMKPQGLKQSRDYQEWSWAMAHARAMKILVPLRPANFSLGCVFDGAFCGARLQACRVDSRVDVLLRRTAQIQ